MKVNIFQRGFNYAQDGPGNRLVYHIQGCNMHCPWCANPEGLYEKGAIMIESGVVDEVCPFNALKSGIFDSKICNGCERPCLASHNTGVSLSCKEYEIPELIEDAISAKPMFFDLGGVTFTGGEPTLNIVLLEKILTQLKQNEINTAIETNGSHPHLTDIIPVLDFLIIDFKHYDEYKHKKVLGISNSNIKKNLVELSRDTGVNIRIPLVGGFNDDRQDAYGFTDFLSKCNTDNITVEFLKFHEYGKSKWEKVGMLYTMTQDAYIKDQTVAMFTEIFNEHAIKTVIT